MPFACIFVPDFPAEAIVRSEPELHAQAVAVLEGKPPLQKVFAVNEKARRAGIEPGMTKIQIEASHGNFAAPALCPAGDGGALCAARLRAIVLATG